MKHALAIIAIMALTACNKEPGTGGQATINGSVYEYFHSSINDPNPSYYPATDEDVYIIYGDDLTYSDRQRTGPNGHFEFKNLRKGTYTIYVYSDDTVAPQDPQVAVMETVEITERKQVITTPDMEIHAY